MHYTLTLHHAGKTVAQYRGRHPFSGATITLYAPYDGVVTLDNPPTVLSVLIDTVTQNDVELTT